MIILVAAAEVAAVAPAFAPPVDTRIAYRYVRTDPSPDGDIRIDSLQSFRFARSGAGYLASTVAETLTVEASPRRKPVFEALLGPLTHVETRMMLDATGTPGALVDPDASAGALRDSTRAQTDKIAWATLDPDIAKQVRAMLAAEVAPEGIERRLRAAFDPFLPPPLPPLRPGETETFTTSIATPAGPLPANGTVTREAGDSPDARYRILVRTAPEAGDAAASALRARAGSLPPAAAAKLEAFAGSLAGMAFVERTTLAIDRKTGLLSEHDSVRAMIGKDGAEQRLGHVEIHLIR